ncbi:MAG: ATP-dependent DNA helicase [Candidatus Aenigmarchaeota archaeon]|nr:ATP-dependent DNA helicase [Candidatus Aenigmarchaeota archaeon]
MTRKAGEEQAVKELQVEPNIPSEHKLMSFPYLSVRPSQQEMISDVKMALQERRHLIADAPTGLGKTIASLFPAVEYAQENGKTVFFLTSRLSQHKMAIETMQQLGIPAVDIIGKKWLCSHDVQDFDSTMFSNFCHGMVSNRQCKYYNNFRVKEVTYGAQQMIIQIGNKPLHSEDAKKLAGHTYCTYELLMEAAKKSVVIVADYFHIFSSNERKFFKRLNKSLENSIIIVDEAHNLPDRIRKNLSSKISTRTIELAKRESDRFGLHVKDYLDCIEDVVKSLAKQKLLAANESFIQKSDIVERIEKLCGYKAAVVSLSRACQKVLEDKRKSFIEKIVTFLENWLGDDYGYARIVSRERIFGKDHISVFYNCMDPSVASKNIISQSYSTILMSGTLSPMEMYRDLLGMEEERTDLKSYPSPFPKENRMNIITTEITTKYTERTPENYARIARTVVLCTAAIKGNVAVFFPSYKIMKEIYAISKENIQKPMFVEVQGATKEERKKLQEEFAAQYEKGAVLFGVLAGSFSEGIDLPGDKLNGVITIGIPLEKPSLASQALIDYYEQRFKKGMDYGYFYPAMRKVVQAAGRCIRTERDIGICVFGDKRLNSRRFRNMFPRNWDFVVTERPELEIRKFFATR